MLRRLKSLENFKIDKLLEEIEEHAYMWNLERKCKCMLIVKSVTKDNLIICKHLLKDRRKKFQERIDKSFNRAIELGVVALKFTQNSLRNFASNEGS